jgi:hypothetical protein
MRPFLGSPLHPSIGTSATAFSLTSKWFDPLPGGPLPNGLAVVLVLEEFELAPRNQHAAIWVEIRVRLVDRDPFLVVPEEDTGGSG